MSGIKARPPVLMKMRSASSSSSPTRTVRADFEAGVTEDQRAAVHALQPGLVADATMFGDFAGPGVDARHVDADVAGDHHAIVGGATGQVGGVGAGDEGFGRGAPGVDAGAADQVAFDDGDGEAGVGEAPGHRGSGLAGADDDGVEMSGHGVGSMALS